MKTYEKYKESGFDGIELIPTEWYAIKTKRALIGLQDGTHGTFERTDSGYPLLSAKNIQDNGIIVDGKESFISQKDFESIVSNGFPQKNDVTLCCVGTIGRCCLYDKDFPMAFQRSVTFLRPNDKITSKFLMYSVKATYFQDQLNKLAKASAQSGIYLNDVANTILFIPTIDEQLSITKYLDYKVYQIDKSISELDLQINSLKSYRQSIISEAVTKGLDKNAKMKDSGIEWIGEMPVGWKVVPLKHYLSLKGRIGWNGLKSEEFKENSYAYLVTGQDFNSAIVNWEKCYQIDKERYDEDPFIQLQNGDILVTKDGTIGKIAKVSNLDKPACLNSGIFVVKQKKDKFIQDYLYWLFVSNQLREFVEYNSTGSTIQHLYQNIFENMPLTLPSIEEQENIANYLNTKTVQIDEALIALNAQRNDLIALKQSIISEAVTGKIDVRDWTPSTEQ